MFWLIAGLEFPVHHSGVGIAATVHRRLVNWRRTSRCTNPGCMRTAEATKVLPLASVESADTRRQPDGQAKDEEDRILRLALHGKDELLCWGRSVWCDLRSSETHDPAHRSEWLGIWGLGRGSRVAATETMGAPKAAAESRVVAACRRPHPSRFIAFGLIPFRWFQVVLPEQR